MAKLNIKYVFLIQSIIAFLFGLGFIFFPNLILNSMGLDTPADIGEPIRFYGATLFGMAILLFAVRNEPHSSLRQAIILMMICSHIPQLIFHLLFHPLDNFMVWNIIGLNVIFITLYGYFFIKNWGK
ncbi:MAG: hypothetical protein ACTSPA_14665 [Promethearchaeota archaeon]